MRSGPGMSLITRKSWSRLKGIRRNRTGGDMVPGDGADGSAVDGTAYLDEGL